MYEHDDLIAAGRESQRRLDAMTVQENLAAARTSREAKPRLRTERQRQHAEGIAQDFENRAAELMRLEAPHAPPP